jgi:amino acid transporter
MKLKRNLGLLETLALSLSIISPTMGTSLGITLVVQNAGASAPLAFILSGVAMIILGLLFVAFERRVTTPGSVYAHISHTFGKGPGFLAGWTLLLTYFMSAAAVDALAGSFLASFWQAVGFRTPPHLWMVFSVGTLIVSAWLAWRDTRSAARIMLFLEGISILALVFLCLRAFVRMPFSMRPLHIDPAHGWSGLGYGMAFAILSFAGFEGAATLKEEAKDPERTVSMAILGTAILCGFLFTFIAYAVVIGYGLDHMQILAQADSPFAALSEKFVSHPFAICIELAVAISAIACTLGSLTAAARMLYTLGHSIAPGLTVLDRRHSTPARAIFILTGVALIALPVFGLLMGAVPYGEAGATVAVLALILVYLGVAIAEVAEARRARQLLWGFLGGTAAIVLLCPLWNSVYPVPPWPGNLLPYLVAGWVALGGLLIYWIKRCRGKSAWETAPSQGDADRESEMV